MPKGPRGTGDSYTFDVQATYPMHGTTPTGYPALTTGPVAVATAIENPHVFYDGPDNTTEDWNISPNDALWGDGIAKSVYDPCPEGWRVPPGGTWDDFGSAWDATSTFSKDANWTAANADIAGGLYTAGDVKAFYPATGYYSHSYGAGAFNDAGYFATFWSSSPSSAGSSKGLGLFFFPYSLGPNATPNRLQTCSVRCIQE